MQTIKLKGELEIDRYRGVIYFHNEATGHTALRICGLPIIIPDPSPITQLLDITLANEVSQIARCNWGNEEVS